MITFPYVLVIMVMFADGSTMSKITGADSLEGCQAAGPAFATRFSQQNPEPRGHRMAGWNCIKLKPEHQTWLKPSREGVAGKGLYQKETIQ
jgi:hypothetical protein